MKQRGNASLDFIKSAEEELKHQITIFEGMVFSCIDQKTIDVPRGTSSYVGGITHEHH